MTDEYSLYAAKANLSKIVKHVRESGSAVIITVHGEPAVEVRPYKTLPVTLDQRLDALKARGEILPAKHSSGEYIYKPRAVAKRGALKRFLDERLED